MITQQQLLDDNYIKINDYTYRKHDDKNGMFFDLTFSKNITLEESEKIENEIVDILTRQD